MKKTTPAVLFALALVAVAIAIVFERAEPKTWSERLSIPHLTEKLSRHTPLHTEGTFLPPRLSYSLALAAEDNPVILSGRTEVPAGVTLTLKEGVTVFAHEFAELDISGEIQIQGTRESPVTLRSNERHRENQIWNGIIIQKGAAADIRSAYFTNASPALSCRVGSHATMADSEIKGAVIGVFTESPNCVITSTRIETMRGSIISKF